MSNETEEINLSISPYFKNPSQDRNLLLESTNINGKCMSLNWIRLINQTIKKKEISRIRFSVLSLERALKICIAYCEHLLIHRNTKQMSLASLFFSNLYNRDTDVYDMSPAIKHLGLTESLNCLYCRCKTELMHAHSPQIIESLCIFGTWYWNCFGFSTNHYCK